MCVGPIALDFGLRYRPQMFPGVPIVHAAVGRPVVDGIQLPPGVHGAPIEYDISGTLELALRLQPGARRVILVTGKDLADEHQPHGAIVLRKPVAAADLLAAIATS